MGSINNYGDIYLRMVKALYHDIAQCYSVSSRQRQAEIRFIESRYDAEGLSFLTKGLPAIGKALDRALSGGELLSIPGLKKAKNSSIPKFLGWLISRVFSTDGIELDQPDPIALRHFRQLCTVMYKLEIPYAKKTAQAVIDAFVQVETEIAQNALPEETSTWIDNASDFITRVVSPLDPYRIKPRHGPGSVATGEDIFEKTTFSRIYRTLDQTYPFTEWFVYSMSHVADSVADIQGLSIVEEPTAKVVLVPKDSRGPRLISCEPLEVQWIQQGLGRALQAQIETSRYTRGHVNFTDQLVNRRLALEGSKTSEWVTLDMKEASDRVRLDLVERLFSGHPRLLEALKATRSTATCLPDGTVMRLRKFAPMGSSLCFPVESLVFYALAVSAIKHERKTSWRDAMRSVYVYGDDIIVKKKDYVILMQLMPKVGLMFNQSKCCTARFFRESCGCDAYVGVDVTPTRLKTVWSRRRNGDPKVLVSYTAFRNALYGRGYYHAADYVQSLVEERYGKLPITNRFTVAPNGAYVTQTSGPAWVSYAPATSANTRLRKRYNKHLHRMEYFVWGSVVTKRKTRHDGWCELLRRFSDGYGAHGGQYALIRRNRLKRIWAEV